MNISTATTARAACFSDTRRLKANGFAGEPSLAEILRDPIVRLLMARDRVDEDDLRHYLRDIGDDVCASVA